MILIKERNKNNYQEDSRVMSVDIGLLGEVNLEIFNLKKFAYYFQDIWEDEKYPIFLMEENETVNDLKKIDSFISFGLFSDYLLSAFEKDEINNLPSNIKTFFTHPLIKPVAIWELCNEPLEQHIQSFEMQYKQTKKKNMKYLYYLARNEEEINYLSERYRNLYNVKLAKKLLPLSFPSRYLIVNNIVREEFIDLLYTEVINETDRLYQYAYLYLLQHNINFDYFLHVLQYDKDPLFYRTIKDIYDKSSISDRSYIISYLMQGKIDELMQILFAKQNDLEL